LGKPRRVVGGGYREDMQVAAATSQATTGVLYMPFVKATAALGRS
jgi:hypothetical protein